MATQITREVLDAYLRCRYEGHLKSLGEHGTATDYETLTADQRDTVRRLAVERITARYAGSEVARDLALTASALKTVPMFVFDPVLESDGFALRFDGLMKADGKSGLGDFHYLPVLFHAGRSVRQEQRLLLDVLGLLLSRVQGRAPGHGIVWHGPDGRASKVRLSPDTRKAERVLRDIQQLGGPESPRLLLNDHCQSCEFRQRCHDQAVREDNLSLLRGLGEKEVNGYARKGILTLTQLAHTFRPRRKGKRVVRRTRHRYHALQALAIRDKRVYLFGTPEVPDAPVRIYLDIEGLPDEGFVYLIGMTVVGSGSETHHAFWADTPDQEAEMFRHFLAEVEKHPDARLFCYGSYERTFLKRMRGAATRKGPVDRVLAALVNVLSAVYVHAYFPCHSNGLKDVAGCLGYSWSDPASSGLQSIVWRKRWEAGHADEWKQKLLTYNREDCAALRRVTEFLHAEGAKPGEASGAESAARNEPPVVPVEALDRLGAVNRRGKIDFYHPDYGYINGCARFDYQRKRVYVRTGKARRKEGGQVRRFINRRLRVSQQVRIVARKCPSCGGCDLTQWATGEKLEGTCPKSKRAFDLVFAPSGIKRRVVECRTSVHQCRGCGRAFIPDRYERLAKHFHGLMAWAMYEHIAHRLSCATLEEMLREYFDLAVCDQEILRFRSMMARYYRPCYKRLLAKMLLGGVVYADETEVKLRSGKGYVWVLASAQEAVYLYRPTREGDFLLGLFKDFRGVLVSDFYAAYDGLPCPQQKCLIHLMRDMNQELLNNPFDAELQTITGPFGTILRAVVEDIDRHGLKHRHLAKHQREVDKFFDDLAAGSFRSEAAEALRARLVRYRDKLFTFLRHDGVAWNNNNAENAIRQFAYYRDGSTGRLKEAGLNDYLVLLSLYQTCRYRGVSFLKFLRSRERDVDTFCENPRRKRRRPLIEVYPKGVVRPDFGENKDRQ